MPSEPPDEPIPRRRFRLADVEAWLAAGTPKPATRQSQRIAELEERVAGTVGCGPGATEAEESLMAIVKRGGVPGVRVWVDGRHRWLGTFATRAEANARRS